MPDELAIDPAHSEAQRYVHPRSTMEVIARQPARQASGANNGPASCDGELHIGRYFLDVFFVRLRGEGIAAQLEQTSNPGQF